MKRSVLMLCVLMTATTVGAPAQTPAWQPAPGHISLPLWPNRAPDAIANPSTEADLTKPTDNLIAGKPLIRLGNVSNPTITFYAPHALRGPVPPGPSPAMLVFPGGGYQILAIDLEGTEVCDWLNDIGIACILVKYRVPNTGPYPKSSAALEDAQRAFGLVRQHAAEWHIDPNHVGVLGFSAGAHLAAALSTHFEKRLYPRIDAADDLGCRPDFALIIYPGYLANDAEHMQRTPKSSPRRKLRPLSSSRLKTIRFTSKTPPITSCS